MIISAVVAQLTTCSEATSNSCYGGTPQACSEETCDYYIPDAGGSVECASRDTTCLVGSSDAMTCERVGCRSYEPVVAIVFTDANLEEIQVATFDASRFRLGGDIWCDGTAQQLVSPVISVVNEASVSVPTVMTTCVEGNPDVDTQIVVVKRDGSEGDETRTCSKDDGGCLWSLHDTQRYVLAPGARILVFISAVSPQQQSAQQRVMTWGELAVRFSIESSAPAPTRTPSPWASYRAGVSCDYMCANYGRGEKKKCQVGGLNAVDSEAELRRLLTPGSGGSADDVCHKFMSTNDVNAPYLELDSTPGAGSGSGAGLYTCYFRSSSTGSSCSSIPDSVSVLRLCCCADDAASCLNLHS